MKITFENYSKTEIENTRENHISNKNTVESGSRASFAIEPSLVENKEYDSHGKSLSSFKDKAGADMVANTTDEMVVLSHTLSGEQYSNYIKDGDLKDVDLSDAVNIVDHIKMELIKGGTEIKGYTDDLDPELEKEVKQALDKAEELSNMTEGMKNYLVSNDVPLTIDNLYLAKYSAGKAGEIKGSTYFSMETAGYLGLKAQGVDEGVLSESVKDFLNKNGQPTDDETVKLGIWLVKNSYTIDEAKLSKLKDIENISLPLDEERLRKSINIALAEGKNPKDADLIKTETIYEEAVRITDEILNMTDSEVHATRVLEEVRLKMTYEANLSLLKSDYSIDTQNLEAYVEALRKIENTDEYKESRGVTRVSEAIKDIKSMPLAFAAFAAFEIPQATLGEIHEKGVSFAKSFEEANAEYEKMFTEVRTDLGDSIKKAFRNVDDLLKENGFEVNDRNRRAARILGYNSMEISDENLSKVKSLDTKLTHVLKALTPADTLNLIRKGTSPINMSVSELNDYLEDKENTQEEKMEKYSKFLFKLERSDSIEPEERKQYIEVYRLLHQLEKTGYAAIGGLIKTGRELSLKNLKEESRSLKHIGTDIKIGDEFGPLIRELEDTLSPSKLKAAAISDNTTLNQVYDAMSEVVAEAKEDEAYAAEKFNEFKEGLNVSKDTVYELINHGEHITSLNLTAMDRLLNRKGSAFKKVDELRGKKFRDEAEKVINEFEDKETSTDNYKTMVDNSQDAVFDAAMEAEKYVDVKELLLTHKQLSVAFSLAREETYNVPISVDGDLTDVTVKIIHSREEDAKVSVSMETESLGKINATFRSEAGETTGYIACNFKETVTKLSKMSDILGSRVSVVYSKEADTSAFTKTSMKENKDEVSSAKLYRIAKTFLENIG